MLIVNNLSFLFLIYQRDDKNQDTATKIKDAGRNVWIVPCDLSDKEQVKTVIKKITSKSEEGGLGLDIDILVNCGGIQRR